MSWLWKGPDLPKQQLTRKLESGMNYAFLTIISSKIGSVAIALHVEKSSNGRTGAGNWGAMIYPQDAGPSDCVPRAGAKGRRSDVSRDGRLHRAARHGRAAFRN